MISPDTRSVSFINNISTVNELQSQLLSLTKQMQQDRDRFMEIIAGTQDQSFQIYLYQ